MVTVAWSIHVAARTYLSSECRATNSNDEVKSLLADVLPPTRHITPKVALQKYTEDILTELHRLYSEHSQMHRHYYRLEDGNEFCGFMQTSNELNKSGNHAKVQREWGLSTFQRIWDPCKCNYVIFVLVFLFFLILDCREKFG
jgi:hypothetical protein